MLSSDSAQESIKFEKVIAYLVLALLAALILLTAHMTGVFYKTDIEGYIQKNVSAMQRDRN